MDAQSTLDSSENHLVQFSIMNDKDDAAPLSSLDQEIQTALDEDLINAAQVGDSCLVGELLSQGANPLTVSSESPFSTALCAAAYAGSLDCVRLLLAVSDPKHVGGEGGALSFAAAAGNAECLEWLLPHCDPKAIDQAGRTPLMDAARFGHVECLSLLMSVSDRSARVKSSGHNIGRNALMMAAASNEPRTGEMIALFAAAMSDEELNATDDNGQTALMLAVMSAPNQGKEADWGPLLGRADANIRDENNATALDLAVAEEWIDDVARLAPWTDLRAERVGKHPIALAAKLGRWEIADFLAPLSRREDADRALAASKGRMPLWLAHVEQEALSRVVADANERSSNATGGEAGEKATVAAAKRAPRSL